MARDNQLVKASDKNTSGDKVLKENMMPGIKIDSSDPNQIISLENGRQIDRLTDASAELSELMNPEQLDLADGSLLDSANLANTELRNSGDEPLITDTETGFLESKNNPLSSDLFAGNYSGVARSPDANLIPEAANIPQIDRTDPTDASQASWEAAASSKKLSSVSSSIEISRNTDKSSSNPSNFFMETSPQAVPAKDPTTNEVSSFKNPTTPYDETSAKLKHTSAPQQKLNIDKVSKPETEINIGKNVISTENTTRELKQHITRTTRTVSSDIISKDLEGKALAQPKHSREILESEIANKPKKNAKLITKDLNIQGKDPLKDPEKISQTKDHNLSKAISVKGSESTSTFSPSKNLQSESTSPRIESLLREVKERKSNLDPSLIIEDSKPGNISNRGKQNASYPPITENVVSTTLDKSNAHRSTATAQEENVLKERSSVTSKSDQTRVAPVGSTPEQKTQPESQYEKGTFQTPFILNEQKQDQSKSTHNTPPLDTKVSPDTVRELEDLQSHLSKKIKDAQESLDSATRFNSLLTSIIEQLNNRNVSDKSNNEVLDSESEEHVREVINEALIQITLQSSLKDDTELSQLRGLLQGQINKGLAITPIELLCKELVDTLKHFLKLHEVEEDFPLPKIKIIRPENEIEDELPIDQRQQVQKDSFEGQDLFFHKIRGRITHAKTGKPLVNVIVDWGLLKRAYTDANGEFVFLNIPSGTVYSIKPSKEGYYFSPGTAQGKITQSMRHDFVGHLVNK